MTVVVCQTFCNWLLEIPTVSGGRAFLKTPAEPASGTKRIFGAEASRLSTTIYLKTAAMAFAPRSRLAERCLAQHRGPKNICRTARTVRGSSLRETGNITTSPASLHRHGDQLRGHAPGTHPPNQLENTTHP